MLVRFILAPAYGLIADTFAVAAHFGGGARADETTNKPMDRDAQVALARAKSRER